MRGKLEIISDEKGVIMALKYEPREQNKPLIVAFSKIQRDDIQKYFMKCEILQKAKI